MRFFVRLSVLSVALLIMPDMACFAACSGEYRFGDHLIRIFPYILEAENSYTETVRACQFEVIRDGKRMYHQIGKGFELRALYEMPDGEQRVLPPGTDMTGDGTPELVMAERENANADPVLHIYEMGDCFRHIVSFYDTPGGYFTDADSDGIFEIVLPSQGDASPRILEYEPTTDTYRPFKQFSPEKTTKPLEPLPSQAADAQSQNARAYNAYQFECNDWVACDDGICTRPSSDNHDDSGYIEVYRNKKGRLNLATIMISGTWISFADTTLDEDGGWVEQCNAGARILMIPRSESKNPPASSQKTQDDSNAEYRFGDYLVRIFKRNDSTYLEISQRGKHVYFQKGTDLGATEFEVQDACYETRIGEKICLSPCSDINNDGIPELIIAEHELGGARLFTNIHIFQLGSCFRYLASFYPNDGEFWFEDIDNNGILEVLEDNGLLNRIWGFSSKDFPPFIYRYNPAAGEYQLAKDLMRSWVSSDQELDEVISEHDTFTPENLGWWDEERNLPAYVVNSEQAAHADKAYEFACNATVYCDRSGCEYSATRYKTDNEILILTKPDEPASLAAIVTDEAEAKFYEIIRERREVMRLACDPGTSVWIIHQYDRYAATAIHAND